MLQLEAGIRLLLRLVLVFSVLLHSRFAHDALPLTQWLNEAVFNLPPDLPQLSVQLPLGFHLALSIEGGFCTKLKVASIRVPYVAFEDRNLITDLSVRGFCLSCRFSANASLARKHELLGTGPIDVDLQVDCSTQGDLGARVVFAESPQLPKRIDLSKWDTTIKLATLKFIGKTVVGKYIAGELDLLRPLLMSPFFMNRFLHELVDTFVSGPLSNSIARWAAVVQSSGALSPTNFTNEPTLRPGTMDIRKISTGTFAHAGYAVLTDVLHLGDASKFKKVLQQIISFLNLDVPSGQTFHFARSTQIGLLSFTFELHRCLGSIELHGNTSAHVIDGQFIASDAMCDASIHISFLPSAFPITGSILNVSVGLNGMARVLNFSGSMLIGLDEQLMLEQYELDQVQHLGCILRALVPLANGSQSPALSLLGSTGNATQLALLMQSEDMDPLARQLFPAISTILNVTFLAFQPVLSMFLQGGGATRSVKLVNDFIANLTASSPTCPATNFTTGLYEPADSTAKGIAGTCFILSLVVLLVAGSVQVKTRMGYPRHRQAELQNVTPLVATGGASIQHSALCKSCSSKWVSYAITFLACGTIGLFLISLTSLQVVLRASAYWEASPDPTLQYADLRDLFDLTMKTVLTNFWNSKCYPLFFFIILWSLVWPIVKLLIMLWCWHASALYFDPSIRGPILTFLDLVGKFSLFDPLLFTMFMVGFRVSWQGTCTGSTCGLSLKAVPQIGFYCLYLGTVLSLGIGEIVLWYNRKLEALEARYIRAASSRSISVLASRTSVVSGSSTFNSPARTSQLIADAVQDMRDDSCDRRPALTSSDSIIQMRDARVVLPFWKIVEMGYASCIATWILVLATFGCTVVAVVSDLYVYGWAGLIGAFKLITHEPLQPHYSILYLLRGVLQPYDDTIASVAVSYLLFIVIFFFLVLAPCVYVTLLLLVWAIPLTPKWQYRCFIWGQTVNAWSAMDVFVIAVFVSMFGGESFGISSFVSFMLEHGTAQPVCDMLKDHLGIRCVVFTPQPLWGAYVLLIASLLQFITGQVVYREWRRVVKCNG